MKLSEVFSQLVHGELSQINLGRNDEGELDEENYPALLAHINLGLGALYRRFNLKEGRLNFPLSPDGNVYKLTVTDINKIERVLSVEGTEFPLNNESEPYSCFTPTMESIRIPQKVVAKDPDVPDKYKTEEVVVVYRASHPRLVMVSGYINPAETEVELPYTHLEALLYFVASRAHNPIGMVNEFNAGNNWAAKYEQECQRLEMLNLEIDEGIGNDRLIRQGWV